MNIDATDGWRDAAANADLTVTLPGDIPMFFRRIEKGSFQMGSRGVYRDEEPRHTVCIPEDFFMATFPVTQAQWFALMGTTPEQMKAKGGSYGDVNGLGPLHPMYFINWHDAGEFIEAFNEHTGRQAILPSEAHWEYSCRAKTETEYYTGDGEAALQKAGWFAGNEAQPVGGLASNDFGLYDMHGNVWEWCADAWDDQAYSKRPDGCAAEAWATDNAVPYRVVRGGSWDGSAGFCRSAFRYWDRPRDRSGIRGFRLLLRSPGPVAIGSGATEQPKAEPETGVGGRRMSPETQGEGAAEGRRSGPSRAAGEGVF